MDQGNVEGTLDYALISVDAASLLRKIPASDPDAAAGHALAVEYCTQALAILRKYSVQEFSGLYSMTYAEHALSLLSAGDAAEAVRSFDAAFQRSAGRSSAAPTPRNDRPVSGQSKQSSRAGSRRMSNSSISECNLAGFNERAFVMEAAIVAAELADLLESQHSYADAVSLRRYALAASIHFFGGAHTVVSAATNNLAVNLYSQGQLDEAEALYREDLRICEQLYGPDDLSVAGTLNNLACLLDQQGRSHDAEAMYLRDLDITKKKLGDRHHDVATSLNNIGTSYLRRSEFVKAEQMFLDAKSIREEAFGPRSIPVAEVVNNLAALFKRTHRLKEAKEMWELALGIYETTFGPNHPNSCFILENLNILAEETGDYAKAEELMETIMSIKQEENEQYIRARTKK
jgi:tetratricopeptide (TPR) repeat protein